MPLPIRVVPLGAGQDVGRSCVLVSIANKNIMFDCGMHMGYSDHRRFPDFSYISRSLGPDQSDLNSLIDCVIISHFHLDHCGALPYFTEVCGYSGPVYMTHPTRAIAPILLEDMRKVAVERKGETDFFTSADVKNCMRKVTPVSLLETVHVDAELEIKPYYAGHVLGAAMFHVRVTDGHGFSQSVVYTGDYNMTPDRHLGSAQIDPCEPDLIITESTYATTIRDSKRARERDFLKKLHDCVREGGKVLVPVFALGRAQELLILVESYWRRMDDLSEKVPVYFSTGLTVRANEYYRLFVSWTNENVKRTFVERNMFDFGHICAWEPSFADEPGAMVLFATPGMLHAGTSLEVFKKWCHDPKNMVIMPGYCVAGTVGAKVLAGERLIDIDRFTKLHVNMQVNNLSFSAHADAKGILQLIRASHAKNVMLVHGEKHKMALLKSRIERELGIPCYDPPNGVTVQIPIKPRIPVFVSEGLICSGYQNMQLGSSNTNSEARQNADPKDTSAMSIQSVPSTEGSKGKNLSSTNLSIDRARPIRSLEMNAASLVIQSIQHSRATEHPSSLIPDSKPNRRICILPPSKSETDNPDASQSFRTSFTLSHSFNPLLMPEDTDGGGLGDVTRSTLKHVFEQLRPWAINLRGIDIAFEDKCSTIYLGQTVRITLSQLRAHALDFVWQDGEEQIVVEALALINQTLR